jgi:hypothetical protein
VVGGRPAGASVVHTLLGAPMPVSLSAARQGPTDQAMRRQRVLVASLKTCLCTYFFTAKQSM